MSGSYDEIADVAADEPVVYEHGWQSWSPSGRYLPGDSPPRPVNARYQTMGYRPDRPVPPGRFQGEGLLAVADGSTTHLWSATDPTDAVASIRAEVTAGRVRVTTDGPVDHVVDTGPDGLGGALCRWAQTMADRSGARPPRSLPPGWCSWYCYWMHVTEQDVLDNLAALDELDLRAEVVQVDDGYQAELGDWLSTGPAFSSMDSLARRIEDAGRTPGIWLAPLVVGERSEVARRHPDWLVAGERTEHHHWDQQVYVLDVTRQDAAEWLQHVVRTLVGWGYRYLKLDFLYAGALETRRHQDTGGVAAYREAMRLIRDAAGDDTVLVGCGAPILPSIGLVDAMRVSADVAPWTAPLDGDESGPSLRAALRTGRARAFLHGRWWVNDADCLLARGETENRELWARHVEETQGLVVSSDPLLSLDAWGLEVTRRLLRPSGTQPLPAATCERLLAAPLP